MKTLAVLLTAGLLSGSVNTVCFAQDNAVETPATVAVVEGETNLTEDEKPDDEKPDDEKSEAAEVRSDEEATINLSKEDGAFSYSIQIDSTAQSDSDDGEEPKVKVGGKVIVVGPDGKRKVYDISGKDGQAFQFHLDADDKNVFKSLHDVLIMKEGHELHGVPDAESGEVQEERFVIGVQCEEAGEVLRSHLHLGGSGVVVMDVRDETPAAKAGLQKNDIIVKIDEKDLASREDLMDAVGASEGKALTLSIIRAGEKQTIAVEPKKMKVPVIVAPAEVEGEWVEALNLPGLEAIPEEVRKQLLEKKGSVRIHRIHPGVVIDGEIPRDEESLNKMIERIRKSAGDEAAKAVAEAHQAHAHARDAHADAQKSTEGLSDSLRSLHKQMEAMQQQMNALQKQLEAKRAEKE
ncbi:MAG: PDZ domain-containing protein [Fuerstia sp.]|nr:PDZ domain-containing protein [Fuerstiella sp.]